MKTVRLLWGIHNHQPVGNFEGVFEEACDRAYAPFLEVLRRHSQMKIGLHVSGVLLKWIEKHRPKLIDSIGALVEKGQIEMWTGGFYEPILPAIPDRDKIGQIRKLTRYLEDLFGQTPKGMWVAERVWEPHLPKAISEAGVEYALLDGMHFRYAGLNEEDLFGYYVTEEQGVTLKLFPINEIIRHAVPFSPVADTISYLHDVSSEDGRRAAVFADDGEKFGIWSKTFHSVYEEGWLDELFTEIEEKSSWIKSIHFSEHLASVGPLGRVYLPTASYVEMMEWAQPARTILEYKEAERFLERHGKLEPCRKFFKGGFWRNFLVKYPESNHMHQKMVRLSDRIERLAAYGADPVLLDEARDQLWQGQCNCPYWHGVFGGLYLNFLRHTTYEHLILGENAADRAEGRRKPWIACERTDFDKDGDPEILVESDRYALVFRPSEGGALIEWDYRPKSFNLLDTMTRREEAYHSEVAAARKRGGANIHGPLGAKEAGLEQFLHYDTYRRSALIDHFLRPDARLADFAACRYDEQGDFVASRYEDKIIEHKRKLRLVLSRHGSVQVGADRFPLWLEKSIDLKAGQRKIVVQYALHHEGAQEAILCFGVEFGLSLLAGDAPDRYYHSPDADFADPRLGSTGASPGVSSIALADEWSGIEVRVSFDRKAELWRFPIETVSRSEDGFELSYQSSVIFPHWIVPLSPKEDWRVGMVLEVVDLK
ncbi:MAG: alpha-amylase/4-alpha-glucanotransferase domain-containing protein [Candidatus Latescibacterota bacterium]